MRKISTTILLFLCGFYGASLLLDTPEQLVIKSKLLFAGVVISSIILAIDEIKNNNEENFPF